MKWSAMSLLGLLVLALSCSVAPQPIEYGSDQCHSCKMRISDPRFGAELVTDKGKVFKYDAIECMVRDVAQNPSQPYAHILTNQYFRPGELFDVAESHFSISKDRPSPMGAFLSAYHPTDSLPSGETFKWDELVEHFEAQN